LREERQQAEKRRRHAKAQNDAKASAASAARARAEAKHKTALEAVKGQKNAASSAAAAAKEALSRLKTQGATRTSRHNDVVHRLEGQLTRAKSRIDRLEKAEGELRRKMALKTTQLGTAQAAVKKVKASVKKKRAKDADVADSDIAQARKVLGKAGLKGKVFNHLAKALISGRIKPDSVMYEHLACTVHNMNKRTTKVGRCRLTV